MSQPRDRLSLMPPRRMLRRDSAGERQQDELELAIYQKVIAILDRYPSLKDEELQKRIQNVVELKLPFPRIAQQLAAIPR